MRVERHPGTPLLKNPLVFNAYNFSCIRYKKSIGQMLSAILDSDLGQEDYAKT